MSADAPVASSSIEHQGFTITTNGATPEGMKESLAPKETPKEAEEPDLSKAASDLGKKGGEAAAKAKKAAAKEAKRAKDETGDSERVGEGRVDPDGEGVDSRDDDNPDLEAKADEPEKVEDKKKGNPRHDPTARVAQATREAREAREALAAERQERARLAAELARVQNPQPKEQPKEAKGDDPEPKPDDYEDYSQYVKEAGKWSARQEFKQLTQQAAQGAQQHQYWSRVSEKVGSFQERVAGVSRTDPSFAQNYSDFMAEVSPEVASLRLSVDLAPGERRGPENVIADEILDSKHAPELMQLFTEHPQELQRLATLQTPRDIAREMAKLEVRLEAAIAGVSSKQEVSKANPPVRPVTGSPHIAGDSTFRPGMSIDEYAKGWKMPKSKR